MYLSHPLYKKKSLHQEVVQLCYTVALIAHYSDERTARIDHYGHTLSVRHMLAVLATPISETSEYFFLTAWCLAFGIASTCLESQQMQGLSSNSE